MARVVSSLELLAEYRSRKAEKRSKSMSLVRHVPVRSFVFEINIVCVLGMVCAVLT